MNTPDYSTPPDLGNGRNKSSNNRFNSPQLFQLSIRHAPPSKLFLPDLDDSNPRPSLLLPRTTQRNVNNVPIKRSFSGDFMDYDSESTCSPGLPNQWHGYHLCRDWDSPYRDPMFDFPIELGNLTHAEKLLMLRNPNTASLQQTENEMMDFSAGVSVLELTNHLPRRHTDMSVQNEIQAFTSKLENENMATDALKVRRNKVLNGLAWLKNHNSAYKGIFVDETRLNWLQNGEGHLNSNIVLQSKNEG